MCEWRKVMDLPRVGGSVLGEFERSRDVRSGASVRPWRDALFTQMVAGLSDAPPPPPLSGSSLSSSRTAFHRNHECDVLSRLDNKESTGALRLTKIAAFLSWLTSASDALVSVEAITLHSPWWKNSGVILLKCTDTGMRAICSFSSYSPQLEWCSLLEDKTTTHHSECHVGFLCRTAFSTGVLRMLEGQGQKNSVCAEAPAHKNCLSFIIRQSYTHCNYFIIVF